MPQILKEDQRRESGYPILEVKNLTVLFGGGRGILHSGAQTITALKDVSFSMLEREVLAIVGESGSGKSTLARCLLKLLEPTSGSIEYNGTEIANLTSKSLENYRRDVQIVYQDPYASLNPRQNVLTALSVPMRHLLGEKDKQRMYEMAARLLDEVGLSSDMLYRLPHQLSGGERQRVNIARALASNPKVLVADEPITMLDASQRLRILRLLQGLRARRNLTILFVTHDLISARMISDRIVVLYLGRLVELGRTEAVLSKPHHPYVELIHRSTPILSRDSQETSNLDERISSLEESLKVKRGCVFRPRCKYPTRICEESEPELLAKSEEHFAACHNPL